MNLRSLLFVLCVIAAICCTVFIPLAYWQYFVWLFTTPQGLLREIDYVPIGVWVTATILLWYAVYFAFPRD